jgi:hypothetical protein
MIMPKITRVAKARQRYEMIMTGDTVAVDRTTKSGRAVTMRKSVPNKSKPLPPPRCDHCGNPIEVGTPYKWIQPRSGPYGGAKRFRHQSCPDWHVWEYSNSLSAQIQAAQYDAGNGLSEANDEADFEQVRDDFAAAIQDLADQKNESADNIESGFGHETYQSEELREQAGELEGWVGEIEGWNVPYERPEPDPDGESDEFQDQLDTWLEEVRDSLDEVINNSPL